MEEYIEMKNSCVETAWIPRFHFEMLVVTLSQIKIKFKLEKWGSALTSKSSGVRVKSISAI